MPEAAHGQPAGWLQLVGCLAIWLLAAIVWSPVLDCGFIWDDDDYVTENAQLTTLGGLVQIWFDPSATPQYYPLVHSTFWVEYQLWGLQPRGYHIVNVVIHAISSSLIFLLLSRWGWRGAWLAGVIFAIHPVHVESVAWVTERKNVLSCLFYLLAAGAYLQFDRRYAGNVTRWWTLRWYGVALVCFVAALLSKTVTSTLPAALLVVLWYERGRVTWRDVLPTLPLFAMGISFGLLTAYLEEAHVGAQGQEFDWPLAKRGLIAGRAVWFYLHSLVWPDPLIFFYPRWPTPITQVWPYIYPLTALLLVAGLWYGTKRIGRAPLAAALFFGGTLFPALGFLNVYPMRYSYVADHFQYLASLGPIALFAAGMAQFWDTIADRLIGLHRTRRRSWLVAAGTLGVMLPVVVTLSTLTQKRIQDFANVRVLWERTLAKNPLSETAHHNLGVLNYKAGDKAAARRGWEECIRIDPCPEGHQSLAMLLQEEGRLVEAMDHARTSVKTLPTAAGYRLVANLAFELGMPDEANRAYLRAAKLDALPLADRLRWAEVLLELGSGPEAVALLENVLAEDPKQHRAHYYLGIAWAYVNDHAKAETHFRSTIALAPQEVAGYLRLAELYQKQQRWNEAVQVYELGERALPATADWSQLKSQVNPAPGSGGSR